MAQAKTATKKASAPKKAAAPKKKPAKKGVAPLSHGVGRRKSAVARVWLRKGSGKVLVNGTDYATYFDTKVARDAAYTPFTLDGIKGHFDAEINVVGGGRTGQSDAVKLGISRALVNVDDAVKPLLKSHGLLTVDSRLKERKKYGQRGARRKFQFVKR